MLNGAPSLPLVLSCVAALAQALPSQHAVAPCDYPLPYSNTFNIYCQINYHKVPYLCDPSGLLSRTEVELLDFVVFSSNFSSSFCQPFCEDVRPRIGIVLVDVASLHGLLTCSPYLEQSPLSSRPPSFLSSSLEFARLLDEHWDDAAPADILFLLIRSWHPAHLHRPVLVPYYTRRLSHLSRHSIAQFLPSRRSFLDALKASIQSSVRLVKGYNANGVPSLRRSSVPRWVVYGTAGLLAVVIVSVRIAGWVSTRMNHRRKPKWRIDKYKNDKRTRAGFIGGMMVREQPQRKSTMMFRSFNKRNGIPQAQRI